MKRNHVKEWRQRQQRRREKADQPMATQRAQITPAEKEFYLLVARLIAQMERRGVAFPALAGAVAGAAFTVHVRRKAS